VPGFLIPALEAAALVPIVRNLLSALGSVAKKVIGGWVAKGPVRRGIVEVVRKLNLSADLLKKVGGRAMSNTFLREAYQYVSSSDFANTVTQLATRWQKSADVVKKLLTDYAKVVARELPVAAAEMNVRDLVHELADMLDKQPDLMERADDIVRAHYSGGILGSMRPSDWPDEQSFRAVDMLSDPLRWGAALDILNTMDSYAPHYDCSRLDDDCFEIVDFDTVDSVVDATVHSILSQRDYAFDFGDIVDSVVGGAKKVLGGLAGSAVPSGSSGGSWLETLGQLAGTALQAYVGGKADSKDAKTPIALVEKAVKALSLPGVGGRPFNNAMLEALAKYINGKAEILDNELLKLRLGQLIMWRFGEVGRPEWVSEPYWASVDADMRQLMLDCFYFILTKQGGAVTPASYAQLANVLGVQTAQLAPPAALVEWPELTYALPNRSYVSGSSSTQSASLRVPGGNVFLPSTYAPPAGTVGPRYVSESGPQTYDLR
jgi:hypothetical protein